MIMMMMMMMMLLLLKMMMLMIMMITFLQQVDADPLAQSPHQTLLLALGTSIILPIGLGSYAFWSLWDPRDHV
jgi:hypothetical protein